VKWFRLSGWSCFPWWDGRVDTIMKRRRHTPEQAVRKIREGERLLNEGQDLVGVLRQLEVSEATFNRWRSQYGGMRAEEAKRLKQLETEDQRLKKLVAEQALDIDMLKELAEGFWPRSAAAEPWWSCKSVSGSQSAVPAVWSASIALRSESAGVRPAASSSALQHVCGRSPASIPAGAGRRLIRSCAGRAGRSTTSAPAGSGARRVSDGPRRHASADG
jgi:putative transposase